jgi:hypothetical protein
MRTRGIAVSLQQSKNRKNIGSNAAKCVTVHLITLHYLHWSMLLNITRISFQIHFAHQISSVYGFAFSKTKKYLMGKYLMT